MGYLENFQHLLGYLTKHSTKVRWFGAVYQIFVLCLFLINKTMKILFLKVILLSPLLQILHDCVCVCVCFTLFWTSHCVSRMRKERVPHQDMIMIQLSGNTTHKSHINNAFGGSEFRGLMLGMLGSAAT